MINFIIALFVKRELLTEEEGRKMSKALFGRPIPDEYDLALAFVNRLLVEAKLSSTRKYFDPEELHKKVEIENKEIKVIFRREAEEIVKEKKAKKEPVASKK